MRYSRLGTGLARIFRRLRGDDNPLRRRADRVERAALAGLLALVALAGPAAALTAGHWAGAAAQRSARAEAAQWLPVQAQVLRAAPPPGGPANPSSYLAHVPARWTAPDGAQRRGTVLVVAGTRAGRTVTIWTTRSGTQAGLPLQHAQVIGRAALAAAMALLLVVAILLAAAIVVRRIANTRRLAGWESAWAAIGPQWTGRH